VECHQSILNFKTVRVLLLEIIENSSNCDRRNTEMFFETIHILSIIYRQLSLLHESKDGKRVMEKRCGLECVVAPSKAISRALAG
jgi:hypothetical protein